MTPAAPVERIGLYTGLDLRRSKRTRRAVRLMILAQDSEGQPCRQKMSTVNVSLHGCCYQSWHNSQVGGKVELQLSEGLMDRSALVRGRVRYVRRPVGHGELFQIGVEFDSPHAEWLTAQEDTIAGTASRAAPLPGPERAVTRSESKLAAVPALEITPEQKAVVERVTVTIDRLMAAMQVPVQRAVETAAEAARSQLEETMESSIEREVRTQLDQGVRQALWMMDEISARNTQKMQSSLQQQLEQLIRSSEQGVFGRLEARLKELRGQWEEKQQEQHQRCEELVVRLEKLHQERGRGLVAADALEQFRRQLGVEADLAISEMKQRMNASLAALEAEDHNACAARRRLFDDVLAQATEEAAEQFRSGIKAHLYASLVKAIEAVDRHANGALAALLRGPR